MAAIVDDGSRVIQESVHIHDDYAHLNHASLEQFDAFYEIERTVELIVEQNYSRVALQFPDDLLPDAALVSYRIQQCFNKRKRGVAASAEVEEPVSKVSMSIGDIEDVETLSHHMMKEERA